jgi:mRNA interferase MazF
MYKQGDIVVVKFPFTDGSVFKKRPALIISNSQIDKTEDFILIQITSKENTDGLSVNINNEDILKSLPLKSYLRIHKVFTVHKSLIISKLTEAKQDFLKDISNKILN